jgi:predicted acylesterase/phospholipase RssA
MNAGIPCIFRSYQGVADQMPGCTIWQALCASMAHPDLFKSVEIGEPPMRESFVGGGLVCNNPIAHVLGEAKALYPERHISCVMSIGSGHTHTIKISKPNPLQRIFPTNSVAVMKDIATDSERVAQDMAVRFRHTTNVYFRFNVDQGMQGIRLSDWGQLSKVTAHTRAYMHQEETNERMDRAAEAIRARNPAVSMTQIGRSLDICLLVCLTCATSGDLHRWGDPGAQG